MQYETILKHLESLANPEAIKGMARFGINAENIYGISMPVLRKMGKEIGKDHLLAQQLWSSGIHEARILASLIDEPRKVTEEQMETWVKDFNSWDVCDQCCSNLFRKTEFSYKKAIEWSSRPEEFVKRAGFTLMACLVIHNKKANDDQFFGFLSIIEKESTDNRNFVKKAVNWALRQIGKRNVNLNKIAIKTAERIQSIDTKASRWIAADAIRELTNENIQNRLKG